MSVTITIRTDEDLRRRLDDRAASTGKTVSQLVREILADALAERPVRDRTGHVHARLELPRTHDESWRTKLRERNWRA